MSENFYVNLINVFVRYYNIKNKTNKNLFSGINLYDKDTGDVIPEFNDAIQEYNESSDFEKKIFSPSEVCLEDFEQLYGLRVDDDIVCVCQTLFSLIRYVAMNIEWAKESWEIISTVDYQFPKK